MNTNLQLQLFDAALERYAPVDTECALTADNARFLAGKKPWRIAKKDRALKPRFSTLRYTASNRSIDTVRGEYYAWATLNLRPITDWQDKRWQKLAMRYVDPVAYFAVESSTVDELLS